jgi:S-adenosylhomocysteine hydrolase
VLDIGCGCGMQTQILAPNMILDDGADLTAVLHEKNPEIMKGKGAFRRDGKSTLFPPLRVTGSVGAITSH